MNVRAKDEKRQAKSRKELAADYGVHVNTIYDWCKKISMVLNVRPKSKKLTPQQVDIFYGFYGNPN